MEGDPDRSREVHLPTLRDDQPGAGAVPSDRAGAGGRHAGPTAGASFFELADLRTAPPAIEAVRRIDAIFALEREINGLSGGERVAVRQGRIASLVTELEGWMRAERARLSRHAEVAKAIKRWPAFTRFLDDGRICLTNNAAERALRDIAIGRKA
jgi:transposase